MSDIFGRSIHRSEKTISTGQIKKMIKKYATPGLNLVDIDPGEIVVFEDKEGKLKTSNVSLDDILTKDTTAKDGSVVVFKQGKLKPGLPLSSITDTFDKQDKELDDHIKDYWQFRRNVIGKFFGNPLVVTPSLAEVKTFIDEFKKYIEDIKKITDAVNEDFPKIAPKLDKVKIPHDAEDIKNLVYMIKKGSGEYISGIHSEFLLSVTFNGIYRITVISEYQFNITAQVRMDESDTKHRGINAVLLPIDNIDTNIDFGGNFGFSVEPVDVTVVRAKISYIVEYVSEI